MNNTSSITKNRIGKNALIGYTYLTVLSIESGVMYTDLQPQGIVARAILILEIALFLFYIFREKYSLKVLGIISALTLVGLFSYFTTGYTQLINAIMTTIVFQTMDYKKGFKYLFFLRLFMMLMVNGLSLIGIFSIGQKNIGKSYGYVLGYGLGYNHPNRYAYSYVYLELALICWKNKRIKPRDYIFIIMLGITGYTITKSRTLLAITGSLVLLIAGYQSRKFHILVKSLMDKTARIIYPLFAFFSLAIPYIILNGEGGAASFFNQINQMVSYRFSIISRVFEYYQLTLFGGVNDFSLLSQTYNYNTIDNGFIRVLFGYGILGMLVFLILFTLTVHKLIKQSEYLYVICAFVIAAWGLSENILLNDSFNIAILFWGILFRKKLPES